MHINHVVAANNLALSEFIELVLFKIGNEFHGFAVFDNSDYQTFCLTVTARRAEKPEIIFLIDNLNIEDLVFLTAYTTFDSRKHLFQEGLIHNSPLRAL